MNNKMTFNELKDTLAAQSGYSRETCDNFLRNLFAEITGALVAGESVKVKGLGTFKLIDIEPRKSVNISTGETYEIPGHKRVSFTPDKTLAARVNKAFEVYSAQEIPEHVDATKLEIIDEPVAEPETKPEPKVVEPEPTPEPAAEEPSTEPEAEEQTSKPEVEEPDPEPTPEPMDVPEFEPLTEAVEPEPDPMEEAVLEQFSEPVAGDDEEETSPEADSSQPKRRKSFAFLWGFLTGVLVSALICAILAVVMLCPDCLSKWNNCLKLDCKAKHGTVISTPSSKADTDTVSTATPAEAPSASGQELSGDQSRQKMEQEKGLPTTGEKASENMNAKNVPATQPSDAPVYDTITKTRYLTTMAREHYGSYHLWPYIYEENKAILGHPDRIRPGTKVVIPDLKKYGVNPKSKADIEAAKKKGVAIYARYKTD